MNKLRYMAVGQPFEDDEDAPLRHMKAFAFWHDAALYVIERVDKLAQIGVLDTLSNTMLSPFEPPE